MPKEKKELSNSLSVSDISPRAASLSEQAVAKVLESSSPLSRLTHDVGFLQHRINILTTAFDGTHLITENFDGKVRLWDVASGECVRVFCCQKYTLSRILLTSRRNLMLTASPFGSKELWDLEKGDRLADLSSLQGTPVYCDDTYLFCKQNWNVVSLLDKKRPDSKRSEILVYEIGTGKKFRTFKIEDSHIRSLKVSPNNEKIAAVSDDYHLRIWDVRSEKLVHRSSHESKFQDVIGITPDSRFIVLRLPKRMDVLDMNGLQVVFTVELPLAYYRSRGILRNFHLIVEKIMGTVGPSQIWEIHVFDIRTAETLYSGNFEEFIDLRSVTEGEKFCLEFHRGTIDLWDMQNQKLKASFRPDPVCPTTVASAKISPLKNGKIALSYQESVVRIMDPSLGQITKVIPACEPIRDVLVTPDGKGLLTMAGSAVKYWDLTSDQCHNEFSIPKMKFWDTLPEGAPLMTVTPDGKNLILPAGDRVIIRDLLTGEQAGEFSFTRDFQIPETNGTYGPFALEVTPDGKRLMLISGSIGFLGSFDLRTGASAAGFPLDNIGRFHTFCTSKSLLATSDTELLSLWDAETGSHVRTYDQGSFIKDIVFLPSQKQVVTSSWNSIYFWDCEGGNLLMKEPEGGVGFGYKRFGLWLSPVPGDRQLLVNCEDCIALWDLETHKFRWRDDSYRRSRVRKIVIFPDGERFVVVDINGMVQIRNIERGEILATLHVLPQGFIWETTPDDNAPSGWLWTDREDLIRVIACSKDNRHTEVFREGEGEHTAYLKIYNNHRMVLARIAGKQAYQQQAALYASAVDKVRIGSGFVRSFAALPAGTKYGEAE